MGVYKSFAVTVTGGSHTKQGKGCQDSSFKSDGSEIAIAVVADGHGEDNCFRSDRGAKLAVACAVKGIREFTRIHKSKFSGKEKPFSQNDFHKAIRDLVKHIIALWQENIGKDIAAYPFLPAELEKADEKHRKRFAAGNKQSKAYGATLIAATITGHYWFAIHIGDGRLNVLQSDGGFEQPVPWDEKCYLNVTTSICDDDAFERARCYFSFHATNPPPAAIFLCTDGIDDNYPIDGNEKHLFKLFRTIALTFAEDGFDSTCKQIEDLADSFATKGKGDDTSIAGFIDMEVLKQTVPVWKKQISEEEIFSGSSIS